MYIGLSCIVSIWNDNVIDVSLPITVEYVVADTAPNFKGNYNIYCARICTILFYLCYIFRMCYITYYIICYSQINLTIHTI